MQQQLPPPNSARLAITSLCKVLRDFGVASCEPEVIRQAKFDGPVADILWRVLHDTVLVVLAGGPPSYPLQPESNPASTPSTSGPQPGAAAAAACQAALGRQWALLARELSAEEEFPLEGAALVIRQLAAWGAPAGLLQYLRPPSMQHDGDPALSPSATAAHNPPTTGGWPDSRSSRGGPIPMRSRPLLLALGWLVAAAGLYERRVAQLEPGWQTRALLPPYPQDSCDSPAVHAAYDAAACDAQQHVRRLPVGISGSVATDGGCDNLRAAHGGFSRAGGGGNHRVAHSDPFGSVEGLWGEVETAAQRAVALCGRLRGRTVALQTAMDCRHRLSHALCSRQSSATPGSRPLTPYELQLCAQPTAMQRHLAALESATLALLEQQELAAHGALFFEWLGSVLQEERAQSGPVGGGKVAGRGSRAAGTQAEQTGRSPPCSSGGGGGSSLSALESLPIADSAAGSRLLDHLATQLAAAVQVAEPELTASRRRLTAAGPQISRHVTLQHFLSLAEKAVSEQSFSRPESQNGGFRDSDGEQEGDGGSGVDDRYSGGGVGGCTLPPLALSPADIEGEDDDGAWRLPEDIAAALAAVHEAAHVRRCADAQETERFCQLRYGALLRYEFSDRSGAQSGFGGGTATAGAAAGGGGGAAMVAAVEETQRLLGAVLAVARPLARTRAGAKAVLMATFQELPEGFMVAGL